MSNLTPSPAPARCAAGAGSNPVIEPYPAREARLGPGLTIRRALPIKQRRLVGPWCFFDHFGPVAYASGKPIDVAPHPHIGLQTVTWLVEGEVLHNDSLGCHALIRPGELNLMTAGRGIAHSEETPVENSGHIHGVQLWVALPDSERDIAPAFDHYAALPVLELRGGCVSVIIGELGGAHSPAKAYSPIVAAELAVETRMALALEPSFEHALVVLDGELAVERQRLTPGALHYLGIHRENLQITAERRARAILVGGAPFGEEILLWWNFVARTAEEIGAAREDWEQRRRFGEVQAYRGTRLKAPPLDARVTTTR